MGSSAFQAKAKAAIEKKKPPKKPLDEPVYVDVTKADRAQSHEEDPVKQDRWLISQVKALALGTAGVALGCRLSEDGKTMTITPATNDTLQ